MNSDLIVGGESIHEEKKVGKGHQEQQPVSHFKRI
jgi:hypothetical protein